MIRIERVAECGRVEHDQKRHAENRAVNIERDRRIAAGFSFNGHRFDFDPDSVANITGAGASAGVAVSLGAVVGNLRWANPDTDFVWLSAAKVSVPMDAPTCFAFSQAAMMHKQAHVFAARALKDAADLPDNWKDDAFWPVVAT